MFCVFKPAVELWILCANEIKEHKDILQEKTDKLEHQTHTSVAFNKSRSYIWKWTHDFNTANRAYEYLLNVFLNFF